MHLSVTDIHISGWIQILGRITKQSW